MRLKKTKGYRMHSPLSYAFSMLEAGGSYVQKYNSLNREYTPDREVTPYLLRPQLVITDPDGALPSGDYTTKLVSVKWTVERYIKQARQENPSCTENTASHLLDYGDYTIDTEDHSLAYKVNTGMEEVVNITFSADYIDNRRTPQQVQHFEWSRSLTCMEETPVSIAVSTDIPSKLNLSPFKNRNPFYVHASVRNGKEEADEDRCSFSWEFFDAAAKEWHAINEHSDELPWYTEGCSAKNLLIDQDFIGKIRIRCAVRIADVEGTYHSPVSLLRRWYGQYDESLDILQGKYIYDDSAQAQAEAVIENRQGRIAEPCLYFDISIYYPDANGTMRCISNTTTATVMKADFNENSHEFGLAVRELSQFVPVEDENGSVLCDSEGNILFAQFPTVDIET